MSKYLLLVSLLVFLVAGCSQNSGKAMPGSDQLDQLKEVQLSNFEGMGSLNENFKKEFSSKDKIQVFEDAMKNATKTDTSIKKYDYDMKLNFSDGGDKALHLSKNDKNEIILKYIGDSTDTYIIKPEKSKELINLIY